MDTLSIETPDLYPEVESLYVIHAVYDTENDPPTMFWFHTHGLQRCGLTEVDLVIPSMLESYYGILIFSVASSITVLTTAKLNLASRCFVDKLRQD